jgi:hypothetical protein
MAEYGFMSQRVSRDEADREFEQLDFSGMRFPSDQLTIGTLRRVNWALFDKGLYGESDGQPRYFFDAEKADHAGDDVGNILYCERMIAASAYAAARGISPPDAEIEILEDDLAERYCKYALATGPAHASELIRDIERQGHQMANQKGVG